MTRHRCCIALFAVLIWFGSAAAAQCGLAVAPMGGGLSGPGSTFGSSAVVMSDGRLAVGGYFGRAGGQIVNHVAAWDGTTWQGLGAGFNGTVTDLQIGRNGDLYAVGHFTIVNGQTALGLARWDGAAWQPIGSGAAPVPGTRPQRLAIQPDGQLVSDSYRPGTGLANLLRWDGASWVGLPGLFNGPIVCLTFLSDGRLIAAGGFTWESLIPRFGIAVFDGVSWQPLGAGISGLPLAVKECANGDLIVGGILTMAGGNPVSNIARWDGTSWSALGTGVSAAVDGIEEAPNGDLIVVGSFTWAGSGPANGIARWDGAAWSAVTSVAAAPAYDLVWRGDDFAVVGAVTGTGPTHSQGAFRLVTNCPAAAAPVPTTCVGTAGPVDLVASDLPWTGATFRSHATGFASGALAAIVVGLAQQSLPLAQVHPAGLPNCSLLATTDAVVLAVPAAGELDFALNVPADPAFVGIRLEHQVVQGEFLQGALTALSASNALRLTIGAY
ncbi:MAG: hypothetical protein NXI31_20065 [bacterium]|nr:hypothetical protein [bacterium]